MNSSVSLTVLNLHQKIPKGATTKIRVKRYKIDIREIKYYQISTKRDKRASNIQRSNPGDGFTKPPLFFHSLK